MFNASARGPCTQHPLEGLHFTTGFFPRKAQRPPTGCPLPGVTPLHRGGVIPGVMEAVAPHVPALLPAPQLLFSTPGGLAPCSRSAKLQARPRCRSWSPGYLPTAPHPVPGPPNLPKLHVTISRDAAGFGIPAQSPAKGRSQALPPSPSPSH